MAEHLNENQYDDDLTVGSDEYDDSYYSDSVDLFEFSTDGDSPISRLKSLVLSIDWEITDEVLMQFNEELVDLRDIWAGEKVNLIYVQALEKISKYIYQRKAEAHPSAIKLLLTLYHNLEKIVSSEELSEEEKKEILVEDVKRFEGLKKIIAKEPAQSVDDTPEKQEETEHHYPEYTSDTDLVRLKAIVLGIDWEITDKDLNELRTEVVRLEEVFVGSKPKLILLQGIGTIGAYIKLKKSNAHADAFKILHLFYDSLEQVVTQRMEGEEEKEVLFRAVEEFNGFKTLLGPTIAPERIQSEYDGEGAEDFAEEESGITPAFADIPESDVHGFQADEEAKALGLESPEHVSSHVSQFFPDDFDSSQETVVAGLNEAVGVDQSDPYTEPEFDDNQQGAVTVDREVALQGVDVETDADDDSDLEALKEIDGEVAPALDDAEDESSFQDDAGDRDSFDEFGKQIGETVEEFFPEGDSQDPLGEEGIEDAFAAVDVGQDAISDNEISSKLDEMAFLSDEVSSVDRETALQGVDVEMEGDDDLDEEALPVIDGEIAPALALSDDEPEPGQEVQSKAEDGVGDSDIHESVDDFFGETALTSSEEIVEEQPDLDSLLDNLEEEQQEAEPQLVEEVELDEKILPDDEVEIDEESLLNDLGFEEISEQFEDEEVEQEAVDEDIQEDPSAAVFPGETVAAGLAAAGTGLLAASLTEEKKTETEETEEEVIFELVEDDEDIEEPQLFSDDVVEHPSYEEETPSETQVTSSLQTSIDSLGVEINDTILESLFNEIGDLGEKYTDKPLEKTYLQLLSTVVQHVEQFREEASGEAYPLLQSIAGSFEKIDQEDDQTNQQLLLADTAKVLEWQQNMVTRLAASQIDTVDEILKDEIETSVGVVDDASINDDAGGEPTQKRTVAAEELKQEIAILRQSLQDEINTLKNELK